MKDLRLGVGVVAAFAAMATAGASASAQTPALEGALRSADAGPGQLRLSTTLTFPGGAVVSRYEQRVGGVRVAGAGAVVADPVGGPPRLLFDETIAGLSLPADPDVSRGAAIAIALDAIGGGPKNRHEAAAGLTLLPEKGGLLAWDVEAPIDAPPGDWLVRVDAATGAVLESVDRLRAATGQAKVFLPNPVVANGAYKNLRDRRDRDTKRLTKLREEVTLAAIKDDQSCLRGKWAHVRLGPRAKRVCKDTLRWNNVTRAANRFEALMAYHHTTSIQQYIRSLGLLDVNAEPQSVIANAISQDNSFYFPSRDEIQLGTGGVDDGEDADVIVHEYGHAVHHAQNPDIFGGFNNSVGAMGEGFGDYLAAVHSIEQVGDDPRWTPCIMEWDATSYDDDFEPGVCLRRADVPHDLEDRRDLCGGGWAIHCVGQAWSSALLELRDQLGDEPGGDSIMDKVLLSSHPLILEPGFDNASEAIIAADEMMYGPLDHCDALRAKLVERGLLAEAYAC